MSNNVLYPLLIAAACAIAVFLVHRLTRPKPSRADITLPTKPTGATAAPPSGSDPAIDLSQWHATHEVALLNYFEHHDNLEDSTNSTDSTAEDLVADLSAAFESAYVEHPAPDMRAELAATRSAADAMGLAKERGDDAAFNRHNAVYTEYRAAWLERLWQFAADRTRIARLRDSGAITTDRPAQQ